MSQVFDLPVITLALPNIEKLDTTNTDNISSLWTVFSKCKNSLEHGKRLENISWRVWYRERKAKQNNPLISPVPIQSSKKQELKSSPSKSFKRLISSFDDKIMPPPSLPHTTISLPNSILQKNEGEKVNSSQRVKKFFICDEEDESDNEDSNNVLNEQKTTLHSIGKTQPANRDVETVNHMQDIIAQNLCQNKRKNTAHNVYKTGKKQQHKKKKTTINQSTRKCVSKQEAIKKESTLSITSLDFPKQKPASVAPKRPSLLSNMLNQSQDHLLRPSNTPLYDEFSCSVKECIAWEHQNHYVYPSKAFISSEHFVDQMRVW